MSGHSDVLIIEPIYWSEAEPGRLARDVAEVSALAPGMTFQRPGSLDDEYSHGTWSGRLPVWPLDRPEPDGLGVLVPEGLKCVLIYSAAHPMVPPQVLPLDPLPLLLERSQHQWHVAPAGGLCLMQSIGDWDPSDSVADLLVKSAAWRVEYALMKAGVIQSMSLNGIASDGSYDHLVIQAVQAAGRSVQSARSEDPENGDRLEAEESA